MATKRAKKPPRQDQATRAGRRPAKRSRTNRPPPPTLAQELLDLARGGARSLRRLLIIMLLIGGIAGTAFGVWSLRPTPGYSSDGLTTGSPFDMTFTVTNESPWFPLSNLAISCIVDHVRASGLPPTMVEARDIRFPSRQRPTLEPGEAATFTCPFRALLGHPINSDPDIVRRSEIHFRASYEVPYLESFRITDNSVHFAFDTRPLPPRWVARPPE